MSRTSKQKSLPLLQRFKVVWQKDWTILWAKLQIIGAALLGSISEISSFFTTPQITSFLANFQVPKEVLIVIATLGLITWLASGDQNA